MNPVSFPLYSSLKQKSESENLTFNYEEQLNIDLHCGHCVCIYCYPKVFEACCPICRL